MLGKDSRPKQHICRFAQKIHKVEAFENIFRAVQAIRSCLPEEVGNLHPYTSQLRGLYGASTEEGRDIRCRAILSTPEGASATPSMSISSRILPRKPKQRSWRQAVLKSIRHNTCCTFEQIPNLRSNKSSAKQRNTGSAIRTY